MGPLSGWGPAGGLGRGLDAAFVLELRLKTVVTGKWRTHCVFSQWIILWWIPGIPWSNNSSLHSKLVPHPNFEELPKEAIWIYLRPHVTEKLLPPPMGSHGGPKALKVVRWGEEGLDNDGPGDASDIFEAFFGGAKVVSAEILPWCPLAKEAMLRAWMWLDVLGAWKESEFRYYTCTCTWSEHLWRLWRDYIWVAYATHPPFLRFHAYFHVSFLCFCHAFLARKLYHFAKNPGQKVKHWNVNHLGIFK